ncbi:hypothetical protein STSP2_00170 [Anaerohalosphaera lusitana]|uniref:Uncharacterized protein n=1 Tax=Anaerohalosphaera lusitana TaxID=1936003 RepID=A0A1U9NGH0_9BACT|nr:hypothetical protein [Anaerohalosphaera lusitana]AQT67032.1 hypothetical protein STSP2_00170 [Anaerohalosphaera lusitana]
MALNSDKLKLAVQIVLIALSAAWLTPAAVIFLPWAWFEPVIKDYGIAGNPSPLQKYWFVMAGAISGFAGGVIISLVKRVEEKIHFVKAVAYFHIGLAVILLTRGLGLNAPVEIVLWDSFFCALTGLVLLAASSRMVAKDS